MTVYLYATNLPSNVKFAGLITHTFITIENEKCETVKYAAYGPQHNVPFFGMNMLSRKYFEQDRNVYMGEDTKNLKAKIKIPVPDGKTEEEFIRDLITVIDSYDSAESSDLIHYNFIPMCCDEGNCNSSTSTVLYKAGVSLETIKEINRHLSGFSTGFGFSPMPWVLTERRTAVAQQSRGSAYKIKEMNRRALRSCPSIVHLLHFRIPEIEKVCV